MNEPNFSGMDYAKNEIKAKKGDSTMYESMKITQENVATFDTEIEAIDLELGNSKLGLGIIMIMAAFVGVWGVACLIGGLASTESFHEVGRSLITAFTGM